MKQWIIDNGMQMKECAKKIGMPESTLGYFIRKTFKNGPSIKTIKKVRNFIENYSVETVKEKSIEVLTPEEHKDETPKIVEVEEQKNEIMEGQLQYEFEQETGLTVQSNTKERLITKYSNKLDAMNKEEEYLLDNLRNLEIQLFTLRSEKAIYEQFIDEIKEV